MVLGADGVHSRTRRLMRQAILAADPAADVDDEQPFPVEYKTMWCSFPRPYEFAPGDHCITQYVFFCFFKTLFFSLSLLPPC